jgi:hypothetical protein
MREAAPRVIIPAGAHHARVAILADTLVGPLHRHARGAIQALVVCACSQLEIELLEHQVLVVLPLLLFLSHQPLILMHFLTYGKSLCRLL